MARPNRNPKHRQTALIDAQRVIKDAMFSAIMVRDGGCCVWCHRRVERIRVRAGHCPPHIATLDHVIPQADGGAFARVNLVLACNACNTARGRTPALVYAERRGVVLPAEVVAALNLGRFNQGASMSIPNTPTLDDLATMPAADAATLPASVLFAMGEDLAARTTRLKALDTALSAALAARYPAAPGTTGTVRINDAEFTAIVNVPKKVEWDQEQLKAALSTLPDATADHYAKVTFAVDERVFAAAPPEVQAVLAPARTVKPGKISVKLHMKDAA